MNARCYAKWVLWLPCHLIVLCSILALASCRTVPSGVLAESPLRPRDRYPVVCNGAWGFMDRAGRVVIEPRYWRVGYFLYTEVAPVDAGDERAIVDAEGRLVVRERELGFYITGWELSAEGLLTMALGPTRKQPGDVTEAIGRRSGYMDVHGGIQIAPQYADAGPFTEGLAYVQVEDGGKYGYIDRTGRLVIDAQYTKAELFSGGLAAVRVGEKWGFINAKGQVVIAPQYEDAGRFRLGKAPIKLADGAWIFIDDRGRQAVSGRYEDASFFAAEGLAPVRVGGLYGYIDIAGRMIIHPQFDMAYPFFRGLGRVEFRRPSSDGQGQQVLVGWIDAAGRYVWKPRA